MHIPGLLSFRTMAPIVTTSSRKRQQSRFHTLALRSSLVIAVILILSAVAIHFSRKGRVPTPQPSSVLPATTAKPTSSPSSKDFPLPTTSVETESTATATAKTVGPQDNPSPVPDGNSPTGQVDNAQTGGEAEPELPPPPPSGFSHGIEGLIGMAFSADDDSAIPPLPIQEDDASLNDQLRAALTNDIVVYDSDNPSTVAFKERVADVKLQLKEVLDSGGNVAKALLDYQREVNEGAEIRNEVVLKHQELKANASEDEARQFLDAANEALEAEGISPIREDTTPRHKGGN